MAVKVDGVVEKVSGRLPEARDFVFPRSLWQAIGESIRDGIIEGVVTGVRVDGARQKRNAPSTRARKRALGRPQRSLVDDPSTRRFSKRASFSLVATPGGVTISPKDQRVNRYVQQMGYAGFLGASKGRWKLIKNLIHAHIKKKRPGAKVR